MVYFRQCFTQAVRQRICSLTPGNNAQHNLADPVGVEHHVDKHLRQFRLLAVVSFASFQHPSQVHPLAVPVIVEQRTTVEALRAEFITGAVGNPLEVSTDVTS